MAKNLEGKPGVHIRNILALLAPYSIPDIPAFYAPKYFKFLPEQVKSVKIKKFLETWRLGFCRAASLAVFNFTIHSGKPEKFLQVWWARFFRESTIRLFFGFFNFSQEVYYFMLISERFGLIHDIRNKIIEYLVLPKKEKHVSGRIWSFNVSTADAVGWARLGVREAPGGMAHTLVP
jgi:hypothetical protein